MGKRVVIALVVLVFVPGVLFYTYARSLPAKKLAEIGKATGMRIAAKEGKYVFPDTLEYRHVSLAGKSPKDQDLVIRIEKMDLTQSLIPWGKNPVHIVLRDVRPALPDKKDSLETAMTESLLNLLVIERFTTDMYLRPDHQAGSLPDFRFVNPDLTAHGSLSFRKTGDHSGTLRLNMHFSVSGLLEKILGQKDNTLTIAGDFRNPRIILDGQTVNE
ncbi:hypothetical protein [Leptospirillum ferriphilum]|jgi:hypothetical protein|uniref:hypothetical protein n=1 Tax=Leptospirillum ferriphilum TaxID=178606 RepID=UPI0006B19146|nr:hypothetical protein [Leptospirillum ferriphilum]OOH80813.1 hypothetical protein BOX30_05600 [Leptospirillum ferriphilum]